MAAVNLEPGRQGGQILLNQRFNLNQLGYLGDYVAFLAQGNDIPHHLQLAFQYSNIPALKSVHFSRNPSSKDEIVVDGYRGGIYLATEKNRETIRELCRKEAITAPPRFQVGSGMAIRTNADTPVAIFNSFRHGADGIGLCRTGYLFFREDFKEKLGRFLWDGDSSCAGQVYEIQRRDFVNILECVPAGFPITVRLWDNSLGDYFESEHEENPAIGRRGVRVGYFHPQIYRLQIEALLDAYEQLGPMVRPRLEILIPFVSFCEEFSYWNSFIAAHNPRVATGCMIETPRSLGIISELAQQADFLCFGTNDLTQTFLGMSRDDSECYFRSAGGIYPTSPFESLDPVLKTWIIKALVEAREANPRISIGIVGGQASQVDNLKGLLEAGFDYISVNYKDIDSIRSNLQLLDSRR